jgi:hypothetical protein
MSPFLGKVHFHENAKFRPEFADVFVIVTARDDESRR